MNVIKTDIKGVVIIEPRVFTDARGYFFESYSKRNLMRRCAPSTLYRIMNPAPHSE